VPRTEGLLAGFFAYTYKIIRPIKARMLPPTVVTIFNTVTFTIHLLSINMEKLNMSLFSAF